MFCIFKTTIIDVVKLVFYHYVEWVYGNSIYIFFSILLVINSNFYWINHVCLKEPINLTNVVNTNIFYSGQYSSTFDLYLHHNPKVSTCKKWGQYFTYPTPNLWVLLLKYNQYFSGNSIDDVIEIPSLLDWKTVSARMPWGVALLMGGGFALAKACTVKTTTFKIGVFGGATWVHGTSSDRIKAMIYLSLRYKFQMWKC